MHIFIKMKKELFIDINIPEGIAVSFNDSRFIVKGPEGEAIKKVNLGKLSVEVGNTIRIGNAKATKKEKRMMNTVASHLNNMMKGVSEKWEYQLKICFGHFPFTAKQEGNKVIIKNFLGEKVNREVKLVEGVDIDLGKEIITLKSVDKELAGQCAANFEAATKIRGRDKRIFQDGVYIIKKCGKEI